MTHHMLTGDGDHDGGLSIRVQTIDDSTMLKKDLNNLEMTSICGEMKRSHSLGIFERDINTSLEQLLHCLDIARGNCSKDSFFRFRPLLCDIFIPKLKKIQWRIGRCADSRQWSSK
jgi:hypothetical protein